jgi:hypothetical protein
VEELQPFRVQWIFISPLVYIDEAAVHAAFCYILDSATDECKIKQICLTTVCHEMAEKFVAH